MYLIQTLFYILMSLSRILDLASGVLGFESVAHYSEWIDIGRPVNSTELLEILPDVSWDQCVKGCKRRSNCAFINYHPKAHVCYVLGLIESDAGVKIISNPGWVYAIKASFIMAGFESCHVCRLGEVCDNTVDPVTCQVTSCGPPSVTDDVEVSGNMYSIDSSIQLRCKDAGQSQMTSALTCTNGGSWTRTNFTCRFNGYAVDTGEASATPTQTTPTQAPTQTATPDTTLTTTQDTPKTTTQATTLTTTQVTTLTTTPATTMTTTPATTLTTTQDTPKTTTPVTTLTTTPATSLATTPNPTSITTQTEYSTTETGFICPSFTNVYTTVTLMDGSSLTYRVSTSPLLPKSLAENTCVIEGGHLMHVTTTARMEFIDDLTDCLGFPVSDMWVDGEMNTFTGEWQTWDGTTIPLSNGLWVPGSPNDVLSTPCIRLDWLNEYYLDDADCGITFNFICEKNPGR